MEVSYLHKELQQFILSFNTTLCFGLAIVICILMRKYNNIIEEEHIHKIEDTANKFIPEPVINVIDSLIPTPVINIIHEVYRNEYIDEELSPV